MSAVVTLGLIAKLFVTFARRLTFSPTSADEACFIWAGWSLNRGLIPYRDFTDFKPPLVFFLNAFALKLFGQEHQRYRYFFAGLVGASILSLSAALILRRVNKFIVVALAIVIFSLWLDPSYHDSSFNDAESMGISLYLLGMASFLWPSRHARPIADLLGGAFFASAVFAKEPFALTIPPTWLAFAYMRATQSGDKRNLWRFAIASCSGVALVAGSVVSFLLVRGGLAEWIANVKRTATMGSTVCISYGVWKPGPFLEEWATRLDKLSAHLVNFTRLGCALPLLAAPFVFRGGRRRVVTALASVAALGSLYAVTLGGCFFGHYFMLGMAGLFFLMVIGALRLSHAIDQLDPKIAQFAGLLIVGLPAWAIWPRYSAEVGSIYGIHETHETPELIDFVKANTAPDDTIFTTAIPTIYYETGRRHAVHEPIFHDAFLPLFPGSDDKSRLKPLYDELVANRPKIMIIDPGSNFGKQARFREALWMPFIENFSYKKIDEWRYIRPE